MYTMCRVGTIALVAFTLSLSTHSGIAQSGDSGTKQDMKDAGHNTKNAAVDTGHGIKQGTKKGYHKTKHATKKVAHKMEGKKDTPLNNPK